ncbi:proline dehydrogenase [Lipingzhangella halophila]|uniref:proline dehydrogenase n=1 Tax=Lipingzhangella halophila TaxID=1783352 RepID=A0A7W7RC62_9ACTN|nr:proline dehydrogenase family protein [Lipingzhangella halophila]MBB4929282.1 proline dehydrogenase [Lipingzhangella halophila]
MVLRHTLIAASENERLRSFVARTPATRGVINRFVAGERASDAVRAVAGLADLGVYSTIDHLGENTADPAQAGGITREYLTLLELIYDAGLASWAEVSVKPTAVGLSLGAEGESLAADNIARICESAAAAGTTVTVDMEDESWVPATLRVVAVLRREYPWLGCVLQSSLRRTEGDAAAMAGPGVRVRLCKGAYAPSADTGHRDKRDVDRAFVRSLRTLFESGAYPMVATHDPRLVAIAGTLARRNGRGHDDFEYQMVLGARPAEQRRLAGLGARVRVYVPYGREWYGYLVRRVAERPANLLFAARAVASRS